MPLTFAIPLFPHFVVLIIVIKGGHTGKDIGRQTSLFKSEGRKGPGDTVMTLPLVMQGAFNFGVKVLAFRAARRG